MKILKFFVFVLWSLSCLAQAHEERILNLTNGSKLYLITSFPQSVDSRPTLIFMPGIFRGYLAQERFLENLNQMNINWISIHFTRHPESIVAGSNVWNGLVNSPSLAQEVLAVKEAFKIRKPLVVSLSYSASVTPHLDPNEFPVVIETAPMGRADETLPPTPVGSWNPWMAFFPAFGSWMNMTAEYWGYRYYWMMKVFELTKLHPRYQMQTYPIAEGLAQLAYSSRHFDLRNQDFQKGPKRFWILGENEMAARKDIQREAISLYREAKPAHKDAMIIIPKAGHNVPLEAPEAYAHALNTILMSVAKVAK